MLFLSIFTGKPQFSPNELMTSTPRLDSFVGSRPWLLFDKLGAVGNWMSAEVVEWNEDDEYKMMLRVLKDFRRTVYQRHTGISRPLQRFDS